MPTFFHPIWKDSLEILTHARDQRRNEALEEIRRCTTGSRRFLLLSLATTIILTFVIHRLAGSPWSFIPLLALPFVATGNAKQSLNTAFADEEGLFDTDPEQSRRARRAVRDYIAAERELQNTIDSQSKQLWGKFAIVQAEFAEHAAQPAEIAIGLADTYLLNDAPPSPVVHLELRSLVSNTTIKLAVPLRHIVLSDAYVEEVDLAIENPTFAENMWNYRHMSVNAKSSFARQFSAWKEAGKTLQPVA